MSEIEPQPGAVRQARLNRQMAATLGLSTLLGACIGAAAVVLDQFNGPIAWAVSAVLGLLGLVGGVWAMRLMLRYWRGLDELARDAHKTAWFWGGSLGTLIVWVPLSIAFAVEMNGKSIDPALTGAYLGALALFGAQIVGYGLFWAGFWLRNR